MSLFKKAHVSLWCFCLFIDTFNDRNPRLMLQTSLLNNTTSLFEPGLLHLYLIIYDNYSWKAKSLMSSHHTENREHSRLVEIQTHPDWLKPAEQQQQARGAGWGHSHNNNSVDFMNVTVSPSSDIMRSSESQSNFRHTTSIYFCIKFTKLQSNLTFSPRPAHAEELSEQQHARSSKPPLPLINDGNCVLTGSRMKENLRSVQGNHTCVK